jgi:glycosyltransferase involved in cell wall biosynthesis
MAAGLPVIANGVGVHRAMIIDGKTGFLAESADDWVDAVRTLARDPERRRAMGAEGRRRVEQFFSVEVGAQRWSDLLKMVRRFAA